MELKRKKFVDTKEVYGGKNEERGTGECLTYGTELSEEERRRDEEETKKKEDREEEKKVQPRSS